MIDRRVNENEQRKREEVDSIQLHEHMKGQSWPGRICTTCP